MSKSPKTRRQHIEDTIHDTCINFFYYDRKEDETLGRDAIQAAVDAGEITANEIVALFAEHIRGSIS